LYISGNLIPASNKISKQFPFRHCQRDRSYGASVETS
jgi:hypothetical protein